MDLEKAKAHGPLGKLVCSKEFTVFITIVIVINIIVVGLETMPLSDGAITALKLIDSICIVIYIFEMAIKLIVFGSSFFKSGWNIFDFIIVVAAAIPASLLPVPVEVVRILRLFRAFRVMRLVSAFKPIRIIVEGIIRSLPGVVWTSVLLLSVYYIFAIMGVSLLGEDYPVYFGNLVRSMRTLFQLMTFDNWTAIVRPIAGTYPWIWLFCIFFQVCSAFVISNVIVAIIVNSINSVTTSDAEEATEAMAKAKEESAAESKLEQEIQELHQKLDTITALLENSADKR